MSDAEPGARTLEHGPAGRAVSTSVRGNSTAFGFSIMITASFGGLVSLHGTPEFLEIMLFGYAAMTGHTERGRLPKPSEASREASSITDTPSCGLRCRPGDNRIVW